MTLSLRKLFAPALLAAALVPVAMTAQAHPHDGHGQDREQMRERMQEQRQEVYQRAEIGEEKQQQLNEANSEFFEAMKALHDEHQARIDEILTDEEHQALREAMRDVRQEHRSERGGERGRHHGEQGDEATTATDEAQAEQ
ncbi:hypothetical protein RN347_13410 [Halomonas sp. PAMB 3264]|uniref:hypothetical protein n=1 Tax=Halomonas sp. PAMB 3264 TaxID=3075222 RepID=UPI00289EBAC8|nr:hypothetical protein [Halomonas sp. PAMB 3264]WNL41616.1 hypothetical protein RN347_13410 [Halomonas sp. PAMB 3264]